MKKRTEKSKDAQPSDSKTEGKIAATPAEKKGNETNQQQKQQQNNKPDDSKKGDIIFEMQLLFARLQVSTNPIHL